MNDKEWFQTRWLRLGDVTDLLKVAAPGYTEPNEFYKKLILEEEDSKLADKRLSVLETLKLNNEEDQNKLKLERLRMDRDKLLIESDKTQLSDYPLSSEEKTLYRKYRKYLRDLPKKAIDSKNYIVMAYPDWKTWRVDNRYRYNLD